MVGCPASLSGPGSPSGTRHAIRWLTEVTFCLNRLSDGTLIEYVPIVPGEPETPAIPRFLVFEFQLHKIMPVLAGVGTFLSFLPPRVHWGDCTAFCRGRSPSASAGHLAVHLLPLCASGRRRRTELCSRHDLFCRAMDLDRRNS